MSETKFRRLDSLVVVDPESLPIVTPPSYSFRYIDIGSAMNGTLNVPDAMIEYSDAPSRARRVIRDGDVLMSTVRPNLRAFAHCRLPPGNYVGSLPVEHVGVEVLGPTPVTER